MAAAPQAVQGFRQTLSLTAAASDKTGALTAACGASRGGGVQLSGTFTATVLFEQSIDGGTTWIAKTVYPALGGAGVTTATATGRWKFVCGGETHIRVRCSAFTSGPIVVDTTFTAGSDAQAAPNVSTPATVSTATNSSLASAATSAQLLAANSARKGLIVRNSDANDLYLKYGTTATTAESIRIPYNGYWEMPQPIYTGRIDAIWTADGSGSAIYTEL
jgi:hypothetical protein